MLYAKVLNPATNGKKVYGNTGSVRRATNYLEQEAKQAGQPGAEFFSTEAAGKLSADDVVQLLDNNHKGLGKDAVKFHSLVLSPDQEQLALLGNAPQKLQEFTRAAMELYAGNFNLKGGREPGEKDLIRAATIHTERKNRGTNEGSQGEEKPGLQTHIHVVVSARDREQKITLNPLGTADRFNRVSFQAAVGIEMEVAVGRVSIGTGLEGKARRQALESERAQDIQGRAAKTKKELTPEQIAKKDARLNVLVARVNGKLPDGYKLEVEQVKEVARERKYDDVFYRKLGLIERNAEAGKLTIEPYEYLRTGRAQKGTQLTDWEPQPAPPPLTNRLRERLSPPRNPSVGSSVDSIERRINQLASALKTSSKITDVRSEQERARDYEQEM
ncbi:DUF5712 family protein [Hymenobacter sp. ISL-91]|uniref:DUF5712 family protein n=1 Tax=Hymenobacter sp. ISL-91 TaxID=2819151 RepID=UPI002035ABF0|nr:DUF5712 family protein [Hymenobacter sp. ISL-91]